MSQAISPSSPRSAITTSTSLENAEKEMETSLQSLVDNHLLVYLTSGEISYLRHKMQDTVENLSRNRAVFTLYSTYRDQLNRFGPQHSKTQESYTKVLQEIQKQNLNDSVELKALITASSIDYRSEPRPSPEANSTLRRYREAIANLESNLQQAAAEAEDFQL